MTRGRIDTLKHDLELQDFSTEDLALKYGVSQRTILRDLTKIKNVIKIKEGRYIRYHIHHNRNSQRQPTPHLSKKSRQLPSLHIPCIKKIEAKYDGVYTHDNDDSFPHTRHPRRSIKGSNNTNERKSRPTSYGTQLSLAGAPNGVVDQLAAVPQLTCLEMDIIRFGVINQEFRDYLLEKAREMRWKLHQTKRDIWLEPLLPPRPLKLQLGTNSVIFYCSDPGFDAEWLADYIGQCCNEFCNIKSIISEIRRPNIHYCELALMIFDQYIISLVDIVLNRYYGKDRVLLFPSPNPITPGFKVYHPNNAIRMEFLANQSQKSSLTQIMQSLTEVICDPAGIRTKFPLFIDSYYPLQSNAGTKIYELIRSVTRRKNHQIKNQNFLLHPELEALSKKKDKFFDEYNLLVQSHILGELDHFNASKKVFAKAFECSEDEASVFLATVAIFFSKRSKPVSIIEISNYLTSKLEISMNRYEIKKCRDNLIYLGLLTYQPPFDFYFSRIGQLIFQEMKAYRLNRS